MASATTRKKPATAKRVAATKDPRGGLTAAGRRHFAETEGAHLKPGVRAVKSPEDMKRKGSFLRRHYGRKTPSPLTDARGEPTRYALQAHAWGEPVPRTAADVKKLADKGAALLAKYHAAHDQAATSPKKSAPPKKSAARRPAVAKRAAGGKRTSGRASASARKST